MITFKKLGKLGSFGNQLFQYSGTRLYAYLRNYKYSFPKWIGNDIFSDIKSYSNLEYLLSFFLPVYQLEDLKKYTFFECVKRRIVSDFQPKARVSMKQIYKEAKDNINIYGYLQDEHSIKMLYQYKQKILSWLQFEKHIDNAYMQLSKKHYPWIGLHIRRGDFVKRNLSLSTQQYSNTLKNIRNDRNVFVCSNDPGVITELEYLKPIKIKNNLTHIPDFVFDFWMLKNAETVIGGGSTFSWWAAYLGNKNDYYAPPLTHLWNEYKDIEIVKRDI